jgi:hypothetical protein
MHRNIRQRICNPQHNGLRMTNTMRPTQEHKGKVAEMAQADAEE